MPASTTAATPLRVLRAVVFAVVASCLGGLAHVVAGGVVPLESAVPAFAICLAPAYLLAGRERGLGAIVAALTATQAALHLMFSATDLIAEAAGHPQHAHLGLMPSAGMLVMHAWAIALSALWLSHGETLLWSLLRSLAVRLRVVLLALPGPGAHAPVPAPFRQPEIPRPAPLEHEQPRRGPPAAAYAHAL
ncbi:hypothetical protein AB0I81_51975 [Nonomuraea sp. NPDC050404]|uniref:hypothetical protein n=1 Tax=Nonomuraea sp. NPDC050404 TaxID=3155783 RepID=UPI0033FB7B7B